MPSVLSVKQLNLYVRSLIEGDPRLAYVKVEGEISNFKNHYASGHLYFTLKDNDALIKCVMFRGNAAKVKANLTDGMSVICSGRVSIYEKDGQYQFYADSIAPKGEGELAEKFKLIKEKLEKEGLFNADNKKPLPKFPNTIAVVTSGTGAAKHDIINVLSRRYPLCSVIMCPVLVQGAEAPQDLIKTLNQVYKENKADVIIIGRGGGSAEDLWAFNDENLARTIFNSPMPVISAVGHETDFTICDFVADMRAPTPSAAAELAVPNITELKGTLNGLFKRVNNSYNYFYNNAVGRLNNVAQSWFFKNPNRFFADKMQQLDKVLDSLKITYSNKLNSAQKNTDLLGAKLNAVSPLGVLARGYSVAQTNGKVINNVNDLNIGQNITLVMQGGSAECEVKKTVKEQSYE